MDTAPLPDNTASTSGLESAARAQRRLAREKEMLAQARASAAAGRVVDEAEMDAWIDSIGTDNELPPPFSHR
jgi:predicted transcriptional regulator